MLGTARSAPLPTKFEKLLALNSLLLAAADIEAAGPRSIDAFGRLRSVRRGSHAAVFMDK